MGESSTYTDDELAFILIGNKSDLRDDATN